MPKLVIVKGPNVGHTIELGDEPLVIGRGDKAGLRLDDGRVSRRHAIIQSDGKGGWEVRDLNSSNGTLVNNKPVDDAEPLASGDRVTIGRVTMCFDPMNTTAIRLEAEAALVRGETSISVDRLPVGDEGTLLGLKVGAAQDLPIEDALTRLQIVYHYADVMRNCHEVDEIVGHVLDAVFTILQPDRAAILLRDRKTGALVPAGSRTRGEGGLVDPSASLHISSSILERSMEERRPIVSLNTATDQRFSEAQSVIVERIGSAVACPLVSRGEVFGALYVDTVTREELFGEAELELITGIANQSAMAIATAQRHKLLLEDREVRLQLDVARRIHDKLVPDLGFENALTRAYGWNRASSQVGGDHFGMFENKRRGPLFTIGDSTGHGIGAALLMSTVRAYLQGTLAAADLALPDLMRTLNSLMTHDCDAGLFVTFLLVRIEAEGPRLRTCVAGHEPPLLYRPSDDAFIETSPGGSPLGLVENAAYEFSDTIGLQSGDRLCLFTDGIVEQRNTGGAELGIAGLKRALRRTARLAPRDAVAGIVKMLDEYRGEAPQDDDYTLVLVEVK